MLTCDDEPPRPDRSVWTWSGALRASVVLLAGFALEACSTVYLHSDKTESITGDAKTAFGKADLGPLFAGQRENLAATSQRELALVDRSVNVQRQLRLQSYLTGTPAAGTTPSQAHKLASDYVSERFQVLVGGLPSGSPDEVRSTDLVRFKLEQARRALARQERQLGVLRAEYMRTQNKDAPSCVALAAASPKTGRDENLHTVCQQIEKAKQRIADTEAGLSPQTNSLLAQANREIGDTESALLVTRQEAERIAKQLEELEKEFKNQPNQSVAQQIQQLLEERLLKRDAKPEDAILRAKGHELIVERLQNMLSVLIDDKAGQATGGLSTTGESVYTQGILRLVGGAADFANATRGRVVSENALLVGLAYERHRLAAERIEVRRLENQVGILTDRREAILAELEHLSAARRALDRIQSPATGDGFVTLLATPATARPAATAIRQINDSWVQGRLPYDRSFYVSLDNDRVTALAREQNNAQAQVDLLRPGVDELVAYGKGGVSATTLGGALLAVALFANLV